jgi:cytoskeletal protein RodZ
MTTAGQKLKDARLAKKLEIEDVSRQTKIKPLFLEYIENGEFQKLPSVSYAHGFVKNYAVFLGLDEKEIMAIFRREFSTERPERVLPRNFTEEQEFSKSKFRTNSTIILITVIVVFFFGFILFQYRNAYLNPPLNIDSPTDGSVINSSTVTISGKTDPDATVYVNQNEVTVGQNGKFSKTFNVFPGSVTIVIRSINKYQRETDKKININVKGS